MVISSLNKAWSWPASMQGQCL